MGYTIKVKDLLPCLERKKKGTLREAFEGEEPDFIQEVNKECTAVTFIDKGFTVTFDPPRFLEAGVGYVFEDQEL